MKQRLAYLLFFSVLIQGTLAQNMMLRNYSMKDYLGGAHNWDVDKTTDNRILLANDNGLLEFDSQEWRLFPLSNYSAVRSILFDKERKTVFAGGNGEFGFFYLSADNFAVSYHSLCDSLTAVERDCGEIWNIQKEADGTIMFQGRNRLFFYRKGHLQSLATPFTVVSTGMVGKKLLVATRDNIYLVLKDNREFKPMEGMEPLRGKVIRAILEYRGQPVFATASNGLFIYDGHRAQPFLPQLTPFIATHRLFCAAIQGNLVAIGTVRNGLLLYNIKTGQSLYANRETGLQNNTVLSLRFDEQKNLWLGLDQGICLAMPHFAAFHMLSNSSSKGTGYASVLSGGSLYVGTNQGLFSITYPLRESPTLRLPQPQSIAGITEQVWSLRAIDGTLFCATNVGIFTVSQLAATKIDGPEGTWDLIPLKGHPDLILGCDYNGLFLLRKVGGQWQYDGRVEGFSESSSSFLQDHDGAIWVGHWQKGIYRLTLSADAHRVVKTVLYNRNNALFVDAGNQLCSIGDTVYISSVNGFFYYDTATMRLKQAKDKNRIFNNFGEALRIYETPSHSLWAYKKGYMAIARRKADGHYDVDSISFKNVERELQMGLGHPSFIGSDITVFNNLNGFFIVNNNYTAKQYPEHIIFQGITGTVGGDTLLYASNPMPQGYVYYIPRQQNSIRFNFVMPEYMHQQEIAYSCWLEGYDKNWSSTQTIGEKEYTHLSPGTYVFHVRAKNRITGIEDEHSITIRVLPAWYETWWAYTLYAIIAIGIAWLTVLWIRRIHKRKMHELAAKKEAEMRRKEEIFQLEQQRQEMELREQQARLEAEEQRRKNEVAQLKNDQLETELKHRQSELGDSTMNLMRKNDMLQALDVQLGALSESVRRNDTKADITGKIKEIRHDIQQNINEDEGWDKFEENFNLVYENFMKRLTTQFPELKKNDRKLCAYLRMGLSSKEMASLLNTSVRSIETARYRLRKKLGMDQGDNLTDFIQNY